MKRKRILTLICVLVLVMTLASGFTYAAMPEPETSVNAVNRCYTLRTTELYSAKSTNSFIIARLSGGIELIMIPPYFDGEWQQVRLPDGSLTGYVLCRNIIRPN